MIKNLKNYEIKNNVRTKSIGNNGEKKKQQYTSETVQLLYKCKSVLGL